jgi:hypothetical protein
MQLDGASRSNAQLVQKGLMRFANSAASLFFFISRDTHHEADSLCCARKAHACNQSPITLCTITIQQIAHTHTSTAHTCTAAQLLQKVCSD